jgi:outer membrane protein OmpA-like peptidoglycan-associated protein
MKLRNLLLAATVLAVPVAAKAQPVSGLYVGAGVGYNYLQPDKAQYFDVNGKNTAPYSSKIRDNGGPVGLASVGFGLGNGLRLEIEGDYRQEHFHFNNTAGNSAHGGGNILNYGPMFNALYDINFGSPFVPYVGAGAGYSYTQLQNVEKNVGGGATQVLFNNKTRGSVTGQAILGVAYNIPQAPGLAITGEYRFFASPFKEKFNGIAVTSGAPLATAQTKIQGQFDHAILVGLRYAFNAAPPPPPPAPAVVAPPQAAVTRTYLVFFDWDKADLNARARSIIAEAAQNSTRVQYTRIDVSGYTDTSGTATYNQGLSVRRAQSVQAELVKDGVPAANIDIHGFGDTHPLVPTGPGIREPQNRRVEIVFK